MNATRPLARAGAALAAVALAVIVTPAPAAARNANRAAASRIRMAVDSVTPSTPAPSGKPRPLTVTLTLTNTSGISYKDVQIIGERGDPIQRQDVLDKALSTSAPPTSAGVPIGTKAPVTVDLAAGATETVIFATTTSIVDDGKGLCLCAEGLIYPLFFSAHVTANGVDQLLGVAATYVPSFDTLPKPLHVSWIWPLLERPHRLADDTVFTDDLLAASVDNGRLSRALAVVEQVAAQAGPAIPITLLIDPDLLDELEVMASTTTAYTVRLSDGRTVPGTGQQAARSWLDRLHALLTAHPAVQVGLTPYGDPDVEALTRSGLDWTNVMPATTDMSRRVSDALAGRPATSTLLWPATGKLSRPTLESLARKGVGTVVLNSSAVRRIGPAGSAVPGLARLQANHGYDVIAPLTSAAVEKYVAQAVTVNGRGAAVLPQLTAELAVRVTEQPDVEHTITITPPRYVDPDVAAAVRTIEDTSRSTFAEPISVGDTVNGPLVPTGSTRLAQPGGQTTSPETLAAAVAATASRRVINSLLDRSDTGAQTYENNLPIAIQRCESSAWLDPANTQTAARFAHDLTSSIDSITSGVRIVRPSAGSYTLASNTSPLPITIDNELRYPVWVRLDITTDPPGVLGFRSRDIGKQHVDARSKRTLNIPTTTERSGRIPIKAVLLSPNGEALGDPVKMTVRSTALGAIGIVITVVAGVVLALALLWRFARRLHGRRSADLPPDPVTLDDPAPVS